MQRFCGWIELWPPAARVGHDVLAYLKADRRITPVGATLFFGRRRVPTALQFMLHCFADEHRQTPVADERFNAADRINR